MKKLLNVCLIMLIALSSFAAVTEPLPIKDLKIVAAKELNKINIFFNQFKAKEVTIKLKDLDGYLLFTERVKATTKYAKTYDLSNLPQGQYQLVLVDDIKEYFQQINIDENGFVTVASNAKNIIYNPSVIVKEDKLDFHMLLGNEENVKLEILDSDGEVVFDELVEQAFKIERRFNLSNLAKGKYTLRIETRYKTMYKQFGL